MNNNRVRNLQHGAEKPGPVLYWMSRDQRKDDNWALIYSQQQAICMQQPLIVVFNLVDDFLDATYRQNHFMITGLKEVEAGLNKHNIPFLFLTGDPALNIPDIIRKYNVSRLVTDFDPIKVKVAWKKVAINRIDIPVYEVDSHNIVPCWLASPKLEFAAYTLRPKLEKKLLEFLVDIPFLENHPFLLDSEIPKNKWQAIDKLIQSDPSIKPVDWLTPGSTSAITVLDKFIENKLNDYASDKNDPSKDSLSNLSPYLHFGQISAQRIALEIEKSSACKKSKETFLEELIVRRELADNFCYYNENYDNFAGFPDWAKKTLCEHRDDIRQFKYSSQKLEDAETHDQLWNAAQIEMVKSGKMHGYMRMYWAKKILEWSLSPEDAQRIALYLNDRYELDGRDPNGYAGIAWSIGGVHDRAWAEREVFGKIRYMNFNGCKRKFDTKKYITKFSK